MENLIKRYLDYEGLKYHHDKIVDYIISLTKDLRYNESTRKIEFYNINNEKLGEIDSNLIFNPDDYYNSELIDSKLDELLLKAVYKNTQESDFEFITPNTITYIDQPITGDLITFKISSPLTYKIGKVYQSIYIFRTSSILSVTISSLTPKLKYSGDLEIYPYNTGFNILKITWSITNKRPKLPSGFFYEGFINTLIHQNFSFYFRQIDELLGYIVNELDDKADKLDLKWVEGEGINSAVLRDSEGLAKGNYSVVEGKNSVTGQALVTEPTEPFSPGDFAHAEGAATCAQGIASHAEGWLTQAQGTRTHAEGYNTKSIGETSHAEGWNSVSRGQASHAEGYFTETKNLGEHASGKYNYSNSGTGGNTLFTVGIGNSTLRGNALALFSTGNLYLYNVGNYNGTILDQDTESIQDIIKTNLLTQEEINDLIPII